MTVHLEPFAGKQWAHVDFHVPWSRRLRELTLAVWKQVVGIYGSPGGLHVTHDPRDHKHQKFIAMLGFRPIGTLAAHDGTLLEVHISE